MVDNTNVTIYDILYSVTLLKDKELASLIVNKLNQCDVLDTNEKENLNIFNSLVNDLKGIPNSGILVNKDIIYQNVNIITEEAIEDITKLFIVNKKKMNLASIWTNASMELTKSGSDFDSIVEKVNQAQLKYNPKEIEEDKINTTDLDQIKSKLHEVKETIKGIKFGIPEIDTLYPGVTPGSYNIIGGYTGSLKTTLTLNMCYNGLQDGYNTLYISLEVNKEDVILNLLTLHSLTIGDPVKRDEMSKLRFTDPDKFDRILESFYSLPGKIEIYDETDIDRYSTTVFDDIIRKTEKMFEEKHNSKLHHIVLDHAQLLKFDTSSNNNDPYMVLNRYASYFRQKAAKEGFAVTVVSQTSRGGYEYACKHGGQYLLTGLAEGNELERGATFVVTIFISDSLKASGQIQVQILKNRYGETMLEPQLTNISPEYYLVGNGYNNTPKQVSSVFENENEYVSPFNVEEVTDLDSLLGGM